MGERTCSIELCDRQVKARGWCQNHYVQSRRTGRAPAGVPIPCDDCGGNFRPQVGSGSTTCSACVRRPKADRSPRPCSRCGSSFRPKPIARPAMMCDACQKENRKTNAERRRKANVAGCREAQRRYKRANPDYQRDWARRNPEKAKALVQRTTATRRAKDRQDPAAARERRRYFQARYQVEVDAGVRPRRHRDPAASRRASEKRRAQKFGVGYERFDRTEIFDRDDWICSLCGDPIDRDLKWPDRWSASLDHIVPLSKGGPHSRANCAAAHLHCNKRKFVNSTI